MAPTIAAVSAWWQAVGVCGVFGAQAMSPAAASTGYGPRPQPAAGEASAQTDRIAAASVAAALNTAWTRSEFALLRKVGASEANLDVGAWPCTA